MMAISKYLIPCAVLLLLGQWASGQTSFASITDTFSDPKSCSPPKNREIFHDYINNEQKTLLKSDGKTDNQFTPTSNDDVNFLLTQALVAKVDAFQCRIEMDSTLNHSNKVRYLRGMENVLKSYQANVRSKKIRPVFLPEILSTFETCLVKDKKGESIEPVIQAQPYEVGYTVLRSDKTFEKNF